MKMKIKATFLMAAAAVLLLMPGAAQAQTTPTWSATLTVASIGGDRGCQNGETGSECSSTSVLTDDDFTYGGVDYEIEQLYVNVGTLTLLLDRAIQDSLKNSGLSLYVGTTQLRLADGARSGTINTNDTISWGNTGLSWSTGDKVTLSLAHTPLTLSGLTINNVTTGDPGNLPAYFANSFRPDEDGYLVNVQKTVTSLTVTPTAPSTPAVTITVKLGDDGTEQTVESGSASTAITLSSTDDPDKIFVTLTEDPHTDNTKTYTISVYQHDPVAFTTTTVAKRVYTAGAPAPNDAGPLPALTKHDLLEVSHTLTGLPEGLHLVDGRRRAFIGGTPTTATTSPATVTLTTTAPELGSSASLTFQVEVNAAPVFTADSDVFETYYGDYKEFKRSQFRYTIGQTSPLSVTLPAATGGTGTLTYQLLGGVAKDSVAPASVENINFDSATRVLSIGVGESERPAAGNYGVRWVVTDENGATATIYGTLVVANAPTLPAIADQTYTVGDEVAFELPKGSSELGESYLNYEVTPELSRWAYWPDIYWEGYKLTGTAKYKGAFDVTYTVTDPNGVSASKEFTVTINSGSNAPTSAPMNLTVDVEAREQEGNVIGTAKLEWDVLPNATDATGCPTGTFVSGPHVNGCTYYVVQVRDSTDSFPRAHPYVKGRSGPDSFWTRDEGQEAFVHVGSLDPGDYVARVAGQNQHGAGPWSAEVTFTVPTEAPEAGGL